MGLLNSLFNFLGTSKKEPKENVVLVKQPKEVDLTVSCISESPKWYKKQHEIFKFRDTENDVSLAHYVMLLKNKVILKTGAKFPHYWQYTFGVDNPQLLIDQLYEKGFYEDMKFDASKKQVTVKKLTELAEKHGVKAPKKKADLAKVILEIASPEELKELMPYYEISEKGKNLISTNNLYGFLLKNKIEYTEYLFKADNPDDPNCIAYKDFIWQLKIKAVDDAWKRLDWRDYSTFLFNAAEFKILDNKISEGFEYLCSSFLYKFNECDGRFTRNAEMKELHKKVLKQEFDRTIDMVLEQDNLFALLGTSYYTDYFLQARDYYKENFNSELQKNFEKISNPLILIPYSKTIDLINLVLDNEELKAIKLAKDISNSL